MNRPLAGPQTLLRTINARAILETLAERGPLTRAELMTHTGLSRTAVTQVLRMLEADGAVTPAGVDRDTKGPAATRVGLHPGLGLAVAVRVEHHAVHVALLDPRGTVHARRNAPFSAYGDRAARIAALVDECRDEVPGPLQLAVVGVPGIVTADGGIRDDEGSDAGAFRDALVERLGCPVRIENDVNLAALAEFDGGAGSELSSFALLVLDDGLGAGIIIDRKLHRGAAGVAGEVAYLPQTPLPIGAAVLGEDVVAELARAHGRDPERPLSVHLDAAADGDPGAAGLVVEIARRLSIIAGSIALVIDPEAFVLGGAGAHPVLADAVRRSAEDFAGRLPVRFLTSSLGNEATLAGAVSEAASALRATLLDQLLPDDRTPE